MVPLPLTLITTGGTIDGTCHDLGTVSSDSGVEALLASDKRFSLAVVNLFNMDSRDIKDADREKLLITIEGCATDLVVVGHGTYTICETGRYLKSKLHSSSKTVLLVGAWIPFGYPRSDAPTQVGFAADTLAQRSQCSGESLLALPNVAIAMDSRLWDPDTSEKVLTTQGRWVLTSRDRS